MSTATAPTQGVSGPHPRDRIQDKISRQRWALSFALAAVLVLLFYHSILPHLGESTQAQVNAWMPLKTINICLIWATSALGLNVVVGYAGLLDLGYVAFWAIGSYVAGWAASSFFFGRSISFFGSRPAGAHGVHISFWVVLLIAGFFCAGWGFLIGAPTLRLKSDYLAIVTLGFGEIIPQIFKNGDHIFGHNISNGERGITPIDPVKIPFGPTLTPFDDQWRYAIFALIVGVAAFLSLRLREGRLGRAWLAIREDELAASMMGVPLMRTKLAAYSVGAFAGGLAGVSYATYTNAVIATNFTFSVSITLLIMVVIGGMGNVWGVIVGALVVEWVNFTGLKQFGNTVNEHAGTDINFTKYNYLLFGIVLVLMMLFRREGFLPERRTRLVLRETPRTEAAALGEDLEDNEELDL
jgi:branched-chain amino acid transport system permease protein